MSRVSRPPKRIEALLREADAYEARCLNPISRPSALLDDDMDDGWRIVTRLAASLRAEASARQQAEQELRVTDDALKARQEVLDAIPCCQTHGSCIPHALQWIKDVQAKLEQAEQERDALKEANRNATS